MRTKFLDVFMLVVVCAFLGCTSQEDEKVLNLAWAIDNPMKVTLSDISSKTEWVALETTEESLLGNSRWVILTPAEIIVYGPSSVVDGNVFLVFDLNGKFIRKIGASGRGPCEYVQVNDLRYQLASNTVMILNNASQNFFEYNTEGNCFQSTIDARLADSFFYKDGIYYLHYASNMLAFTGSKELNHIAVVNEQNELLVSLVPVDPVKTTYMNPFIELASFAEFDNNLLYFIPLSDTIYQLKSAQVYPFFHLDFGKYSFDPDFIWDLNNRNKALDENKGKVTEIASAGKYLFLKYRFAKRNGLLAYVNGRIIDVRDNESTGFVDDVDGLENVLDFTAQGSKLIQVFDAVDLLDQANSNGNISKNLEMIKSRLTINSNPVLRIITLKQNP